MIVFVIMAVCFVVAVVMCIFGARLVEYYEFESILIFSSGGLILGLLVLGLGVTVIPSEEGIISEEKVEFQYFFTDEDGDVNIGYKKEDGSLNEIITGDLNNIFITKEEERIVREGKYFNNEHINNLFQPLPTRLIYVNEESMDTLPYNTEEGSE